MHDAADRREASCAWHDIPSALPLGASHRGEIRQPLPPPGLRPERLHLGEEGNGRRGAGESQGGERGEEAGLGRDDRLLTWNGTDWSLTIPVGPLGELSLDCLEYDFLGTIR